MADYESLRANSWKLPESEHEPEEDQEAGQPAVDFIWNVYSEKGDAKTLALRISLRLPLKP